MFKSLFPGFAERARFGYLNLNLFAKDVFSAAAGGGTSARSPFLDPAFTDAILRRHHCILGVDASYGGWLEYRGDIWRGSYLDRDERYLHLGVDFNVPEKTEVSCRYSAVILRVDDDHPELHGWGPRVIVKVPNKNIALIYSHLAPNRLPKCGQSLVPGEPFARVGKIDHNGGWYSHLHVQAVNLDWYKVFLSVNLNVLDGYAPYFKPGSSKYQKHMTELVEKYPDPMEFVGFD